MSVQLVIDMDLSVEWIAELAQHGWHVVRYGRNIIPIHDLLTAYSTDL